MLRFYLCCNYFLCTSYIFMRLNHLHIYELIPFIHICEVITFSDWLRSHSHTEFDGGGQGGLCKTFSVDISAEETTKIGDNISIRFSRFGSVVRLLDLQFYGCGYESPKPN